MRLKVLISLIYERVVAQIKNALAWIWEKIYFIYHAVSSRPYKKVFQLSLIIAVFVSLAFVQTSFAVEVQTDYAARSNTLARVIDAPINLAANIFDSIRNFSSGI